MAQVKDLLLKDLQGSEQRGERALLVEGALSELTDAATALSKLEAFVPQSSTQTSPPAGLAAAAPCNLSPRDAGWVNSQAAASAETRLQLASAGSAIPTAPLHLPRMDDEASKTSSRGVTRSTPSSLPPPPVALPTPSATDRVLVGAEGGLDSLGAVSRALLPLPDPASEEDYPTVRKAHGNVGSDADADRQVAGLMTKVDSERVASAIVIACILKLEMFRHGASSTFKLDTNFICISVSLRLVSMHSAIQSREMSTEFCGLMGTSRRIGKSSGSEE